MATISNKQKAEEIYISMLPFKRSFQTIITSLLYSFKFDGMDIDQFLEPEIGLLFEKLMNEYSKKLNKPVSYLWNDIRFYLKGGKALNKLLKKLGNEEFNSLVYTTEEILEDKLCFIDQGCISSSNSDYDFTLLIKDEDDFPDNDLDKAISIMLIQLLSEIGNNLSKNTLFTEFIKHFQKELNKKENLYLLISSLRYSVFEMKKFLTDNTGKKQDFILDYIKLKIEQVNNLIHYLKNIIREGKDFYNGWTIRTTYSDNPIDVKTEGDESIFYLYRLKLFFQVNYTQGEMVKLNRDIKNFLQGKIDYKAFPFDNVFGELIDISLPIGDQNILKELWASTELNYMLRPISFLDFNLKQIQKDDDIFLYPVASLRYQLKDIITVFNVENPLKLQKRCQRFVEYLKMLCYSEEIPDDFYVNLSPQLKQEIKEEIKVKEEGGRCSELIDILNLLSQNSIKEEDGKEKWILTKKQLSKIFPTSFCGGLISGIFPQKDKLVRNIFKRIKVDNNLPDKLSLKQLKKINYKGLIELLKNINNSSLIKRYISIINGVDLINRILPIEINF